jgi:hypothetical protein
MIFKGPNQEHQHQQQLEVIRLQDLPVHPIMVIPLLGELFSFSVSRAI